MADYFAALAARTLRPELSVQPRQRVRWEDVPEPVADASPTMVDVTAHGARQSTSDMNEPPRRPRRTSTTEASQPEGEQAGPLPTPRRGRREDAGGHDEPVVAMASAPHPTVRVVEPVARARHERVAERPGVAAGTTPVVMGGGRAAAPGSNGIERARPLPARHPARERESAAEPAIRIHIGRVDVRAVMAAAPGAPPVPRDNQRALMSLDEYVQKRDRGAS